MTDPLTTELKLKLLVPNRPWEREPNSKEWLDPMTGYRCKVWRHPMLLHLCGYVAVPKGHALHGKTYDEANNYIEVHGGLTYADKRDGCFWFGFDCGHAGDLSPGMLWSLSDTNGWEQHVQEILKFDTYRTFEHVVEEVTVLALQLKQLETLKEQ